MTQIRYCPSLPKVTREFIEPLIAKWAWLIPHWCVSMEISIGENNSYTAEMTVRETYLDAYLRVNAIILEQDDPERVLVHELCHFYNVPIKRVADACFEKTFPTPGPACEMAYKWLSDVTETMTESLCQSLLRRDRAVD